jgi:hypothetical protein
MRLLSILGWFGDVFVCLEYTNDAGCFFLSLTVDCILMSSFSDPPRPSLDNSRTVPLVHYICVDHGASTIVLTCRGTLGLSDVLVDLTADYDAVNLRYGKPHGSYYAHSGRCRHRQLQTRWLFLKARCITQECFDRQSS